LNVLLKKIRSALNGWLELSNQTVVLDCVKSSVRKEEKEKIVEVWEKQSANGSFSFHRNGSTVEEDLSLLILIDCCASNIHCTPSSRPVLSH
jgi:hypothetical protein